MNDLIMFGFILGGIGYIIDMVMNPDKHIVGLIFFAIVYAIFGSFYETTGARADCDRKKRG